MNCQINKTKFIYNYIDKSFSQTLFSSPKFFIWFFYSTFSDEWIMNGWIMFGLLLGEGDGKKKDVPLKSSLKHTSFDNEFRKI